MMGRRALFSGLALFLFLSMYSLSHLRLDEIRNNYNYRLQATALPVSNEVMKVLAMEFKGLVADYLLLEAASFIGSTQSGTPTPDDWDAVTRLLDQSSSLDPYFTQTYRLAQATLPWQAQRYEQTLVILERSQQHRPWDWLPGFFMGFDHYFFLNDNLTASKILMETSRIPNAPATLATLASRLASRAGETQTAIEFLSAIYEKTDDEGTKELLRARIIALKGILKLQWAIEEFQRRFGRLPHSLDELVEKAVIPHLPDNPYNKPFSYKDGKVDF